jgi:hypothetical protein
MQASSPPKVVVEGYKLVVPFEAIQASSPPKV